MSLLKKQLKEIKKNAMKIHNIPNKKKEKASLLFTSSEALEFDEEAIYDIAMDGFEYLLEIDEKTFKPFEKTLFDKKTKNIERSLLTKEENKDLDLEIEKFIFNLQPYFLERKAQQSMEWLFRKHRVEFFNVETLIKTFLHYHETDAFLKMCFILQIQENSPWLFLKQNNITRKEIVFACLKNRSILESVFDVVDYRTKQIEKPETCSPFIMFFTQLCLEYIEIKDINQAEIVSIYRMAYLSTKKKHSEMQTGAHMILLAISKYISKEAIIKFLETSCTNSLETQTSIFCLIEALCYYSRIEKLSSSIVSFLISWNGFKKEVKEMQKRTVSFSLFKNTIENTDGCGSFSSLLEL